MEKQRVFTRMLAIAGTALVWFPILALVWLSASALLNGRMSRFDYLMPAELFLVSLTGGALLLWAALRSRSRRKLIGWGLGIAAGTLVGGQVLASGETEPVGWVWAIILDYAIIKNYYSPHRRSLLWVISAGMCPD